MPKPGSALALLWHVPGRAWAAALKAAPLRQWWQAGGQMAMTVFAGAVVAILWLGPWSLAVEGKRVDWLGVVAVSALFIVLVYGVAMNDLRLNMRAGRGGIEANMSGEDDPAPPPVTVETRTTTTVAQPVASAAPDDDPTQYGGPRA